MEEDVTNAAIRDADTGTEIAFFDNPDEGRRELAEMVRKDPSRAPSLVLIFYSWGKAVDAITGDELLGD